MFEPLPIKPSFNETATEIHTLERDEEGEVIMQQLNSKPAKRATKPRPDKKALNGPSTPGDARTSKTTKRGSGGPPKPKYSSAPPPAQGGASPASTVKDRRPTKSESSEDVKPQKPRQRGNGTNPAISAVQTHAHTDLPDDGVKHFHRHTCEHTTTEGVVCGEIFSHRHSRKSEEESRQIQKLHLCPEHVHGREPYQHKTPVTDPEPAPEPGTGATTTAVAKVPRGENISERLLAYLSMRVIGRDRDTALFAALPMQATQWLRTNGVEDEVEQSLLITAVLPNLMVIVSGERALVENASDLRYLEAHDTARKLAQGTVTPWTKIERWALSGMFTSIGGATGGSVYSTVSLITRLWLAAPPPTIKVVVDECDVELFVKPVKIFAAEIASAMKKTFPLILGPKVTPPSVTTIITTTVESRSRSVANAIVPTNWRTYAWVAGLGASIGAGAMLGHFVWRRYRDLHTMNITKR